MKAIKRMKEIQKIQRLFHQNNSDPARTRTWNPLIRSQMPYPLGHRAFLETKCESKEAILLQVYRRLNRSEEIFNSLSEQFTHVEEEDKTIILF